LDGDYIVFGKDSKDKPLTPVTLDVNMILMKELDLQKLFNGYN